MRVVRLLVYDTDNPQQMLKWTGQSMSDGKHFLCEGHRLSVMTIHGYGLIDRLRILFRSVFLNGGS